MYNALFKLAVALASLWLEVHEESVASSVYYIYAEDIDGEDSIPDSRVADGRHLEVTIRVVEDDDEYKELFARHLQRQGVTNETLMESDEEG